MLSLLQDLDSSLDRDALDETANDPRQERKGDTMED